MHDVSQPRFFGFLVHSISQSHQVLSTALETGGLRVQVRSIGKRDCGNLFKLGDEMIQFTQLHHLLAASVGEMIPVNANVLLSDEAKKLARQQGSSRRANGQLASANSGEAASFTPADKSFEGLMSSPWKVCACDAFLDSKTHC